MDQASVTLHSIEKPLVNSLNSKIIIVHGVPLMRLAIETTLSRAAALAKADVSSFATIADARNALDAAGSGTIIIVDIAAWSALDKDPGGADLPCLRTRGAALAVVTSPDHAGSRLLENRGVSGVINPDAEPQAFVELVTDLLSGRTSFVKASVAHPASPGLGRLSQRQYEILELMTRGLLNKQIAWELGLTEGTVKSHVSAILTKLGCDRRTQAIATFMQSLGVGRATSAAA
ncbi:MAG TPA: response regulator transcription factor [Beijerinckia sp.]|jgi:DNA-binding NarL/FixJ family response regulator|nr:response regulator transcription factor [Beijerinckia sp.]